MAKRRRKGPTDRTLEKLFSKTVKARAGWRCEVCGSTGNLEAHHLIKRRIRLTRFDPANGICLCHACHRDAEKPWVQRLINTRLSEARLAYLHRRGGILYKDFLAAEGLTDAQWRLQEKQRLEKWLREWAEAA